MEYVQGEKKEPSRVCECIRMMNGVDGPGWKRILDRFQRFSLLFSKEKRREKNFSPKLCVDLFSDGLSKFTFLRV